jgi:hypothetical protein
MDVLEKPGRRLTVVAGALLVGACATIPPRAPASSPDLPMFRLDQYASVQDRPGQDKNTTVVVAISGGGFRAANLGIGALLAMEDIGLSYGDRESNLLKEVDYFTTVSGGGLAAGLYLQGLLSAPRGTQADFRLGEYLAQQRGSAMADRLPAIQKTLFWRIFGYSLRPDVLAGPIDRGDYLQDWLDRTVLKRTTCPTGTAGPGGCSWMLGDVFKRKGELPVTPYWITNATNFTNGEIFSFTPDNLRARKVKGYTHRGHKVTLQGGEDVFNVPLALGMRTSSNFPVGLPATTLSVDDGENLKLSDGGQADNLAFYSALDILYQDGRAWAAGQDKGTRQKRSPSGNTPPKATQRRILVLIDAFNGGLGNVERDEGAPSLLKTLLRSPILPMDALRSRIRASVTNSDASRWSAIDSSLMDSNLAVAYVNIDDEPEARRVGTTFWLDKAEQNELIAAGYRQAFAALTGTCGWTRPIPAIGIEVSCGGAAGEMGASAARRGMIEYNSRLLRQRRSELVAIASDTFMDFSERLENLRKETDNALFAQQFQDALDANLQSISGDSDAARTNRAMDEAIFQLRKGKALREATISLSRVYDEYAARGIQGTAKGRTARDLACRSVALYSAWGFETVSSPMQPAACESAPPLLLGAKPEERLRSLQRQAASLARICRAAWTDYSFCDGLVEFGTQVKMALDAYLRIMRQRPSLDASQIVAETNAQGPERNCPLIEELAVPVNRFAVESLYKYDIDRASVEEVKAGLEGLGTTLVTLPSDLQGLAAKCPDLRTGKSQATTNLHNALADVQRHARSVRCVIDGLPSMWEGPIGRIDATIGTLFPKESYVGFCFHQVTGLPKRDAPARMTASGG